MNDNIRYNKLTREQMQDLFCDYAFGKLSDDDKRAFELTLPDFPDLKNEILEVQTSFGKLNTMKMDKKIGQYTRNLSIKVNKKIGEQGLGIKMQEISFFEQFKKLLVPVGVSAAVIIVALIGVLNLDIFKSAGNNSVQKTGNGQVNFTGVTEKDANAILDNKTKSQDVLELTAALTDGMIKNNVDLLANINPELLETGYDNMVDDVLISDNPEKAVSIHRNNGGTQYDIYDQLNEFDEKDIQNILKELENADFNS